MHIEAGKSPLPYIYARGRLITSKYGGSRYLEINKRTRTHAGRVWVSREKLVYKQRSDMTSTDITHTTRESAFPARSQDAVSGVAR